MRRMMTQKSFDATFSDNPNAFPFDKLAIGEWSSDSEFKIVGWVDLMGASSMMLRSPEAASRSIGCLHEAVLRAADTNKGTVELHPISDGVYVVATTYNAVANVLGQAFRSYARRYLQLKSEVRSCPIRAAIAYGRTVNQKAFRERFGGFAEKTGFSIPDSYFDAIVQGTAFSAAHEAERKAPPFGIYHDESLRTFGRTSEQGSFVTWPFFKWWCNGQQPTERQRNFAKQFGDVVLAHFDWIADHPVESGMKIDKLSEKLKSYCDLVREYFGIERRHDSRDSSCG